MDSKLYSLQEKQKLIDYFREMPNKEFHERYIKRHKTMLGYQEYLSKYLNQYMYTSDSLK